MYRQQMCDFISKLITDIMGGKDFESNDNPLTFIDLIDKDDRFKSMSANERENYKNALRELAELFWDDKANMGSYDILIEALHHTKLCQEDINLLSEVITHGISNKEPGLIRLSPEEINREAAMAEAIPDGLSNDVESGNVPEEGSNINEAEQKLPSPRQIYDYLDQHIYKQEQVKKTASMIYWEHLRGIHTNSVILGPSGCGKTEVFRQLRNMSRDIIIVDGTSITQEGWKGSVKLRDILWRAAPAVLQDGGAIIVIDEFDKLAERKMSGGENIAYSLQSELLKVIEGELIQFKNFVLDTSKISFVFLGSFASMVAAKGHTPNSMGFGQDISRSEVSYTDRFTQEDLIKYGGVRREIASRISRIVQVQPMTEADFYEILNIRSMSPIADLEHKFGVVIDVDDSVKRQVAKEAAESGLGVRCLESKLLAMLEDEVFVAPDMEEYEISG